jgi:hypothetical protein
MKPSFMASQSQLQYDQQPLPFSIAGHSQASGSDLSLHKSASADLFGRIAAP